METLAIATVNNVEGKAFVQREGNTILLEKNTSIYESDIISTEKNSTLQLTFTDKSQVSVGESSEIAVSDYIFTETDESFLLSISKGMMRSISGEIVERSPDAFRIQSPLATIGIRGTTTYHKITADGEDHGILSIADGHTVVISLANGTQTVLTSNLQSVSVPLGGESIDPFIMTEMQMEQFIEGLNNPENITQILENLQQYLSSLSIAFSDEQNEVIAQIEQNISALTSSEAEVHITTTTQENVLESDPASVENTITELMPANDIFTPITSFQNLVEVVNMNPTNDPATKNPIPTIPLPPDSIPNLPNVPDSPNQPNGPNEPNLPNYPEKVYIALENGQQQLLGEMISSTEFHLYFNFTGNMQVSGIPHGYTLTPTANGFSFTLNGNTYTYELLDTIQTIINKSGYIDGTSWSSNPFFNTVAIDGNYDQQVQGKFQGFAHFDYVGSGLGSAYLGNGEDIFYADDQGYKSGNNTVYLRNFKTIDAGDGIDSLHLETNTGLFAINSYNTQQVTGVFSNHIYTNFEKIYANLPSNPTHQSALFLPTGDDSVEFRFDAIQNNAIVKLNNSPTEFYNFHSIIGGDGNDTLILNAKADYQFTTSGIYAQDKVIFMKFENIELGSEAAQARFSIDSIEKDAIYTLEGNFKDFGYNSLSYKNVFNVSSNANQAQNSDPLEIYFTSNSGHIVTLVMLNHTVSDVNDVMTKITSY